MSCYLRWAVGDKENRRRPAGESQVEVVAALCCTKKFGWVVGSLALLGVLCKILRNLVEGTWEHLRIPQATSTHNVHRNIRLIGRGAYAKIRTIQETLRVAYT